MSNQSKILAGEAERAQPDHYDYWVREIAEYGKDGEYANAVAYLKDIIRAASTLPVASAPNNEIVRLYAGLHEIHDLAHNASTGPTIPDEYWNIRAIADRLLSEDWGTPPAALSPAQAAPTPFPKDFMPWDFKMMQEAAADMRDDALVVLVDESDTEYVIDGFKLRYGHAVIKIVARIVPAAQAVAGEQKMPRCKGKCGDAECEQLAREAAAPAAAPEDGMCIHSYFYVGCANCARRYPDLADSVAAAPFSPLSASGHTCGGWDAAHVCEACQAEKDGAASASQAEGGQGQDVLLDPLDSICESLWIAMSNVYYRSDLKTTLWKQDVKRIVERYNGRLAAHPVSSPEKGQK